MDQGLGREVVHVVHRADDGRAARGVSDPDGRTGRDAVLGVHQREPAAEGPQPDLEGVDRVNVWLRRGDLMQLEQIAAGYPSRERFLTDLTLDPPTASSDRAGPPHRDEDYLILSTIHSAKGQEWKNVFVLNVVDGCIPACLGAGERKEIEEERRLLYVAMTRAKDSLHLLMPQRFYVDNQVRRGDRHVYALRSRFISDQALSYFEQTTWPAVRQDQGATAMPKASIDLRARMRGAWG